jgi:folate-dependent phosphoribosylglycinamide formyltransferase PurN
MSRPPLRVAVLCSHRAPGLVHVLTRDRNRGRLYDIVCCLTSEAGFAEEVRVERRDIPILSHPIRTFYTSAGRPLEDLGARREYDARTVRKLAPYRPDVVLLSSYLYVLTQPMLDAFPQRIVNIHHADLLARRPDGGPRYPGLRAVQDAMLAGEPETRATAHLVTREPDGGPVLLRSWPFPVPEAARWAVTRQASDVLRALAFAQTEWMLRSVWGPMIVRSLEMMARGVTAEPLELVEDGGLRRLHAEDVAEAVAV